MPELARSGASGEAEQGLTIVAERPESLPMFEDDIEPLRQNPGQAPLPQFQPS